MAHYFFNLFGPGGLIEDEEGVELASFDQVRAAAVTGARSIISGDVARGHLDLSGRIEVLDANRRLVLVMPFREAVEIRTEF